LAAIGWEIGRFDIQILLVSGWLRKRLSRKTQKFRRERENPGLRGVTPKRPERMNPLRRNARGGVGNLVRG
jgi:hypothetical protein